jgi:hypothetical protein
MCGTTVSAWIVSSGVGPWLTHAREQLGNGAEFLRETGDVVSTITDAAKRVAADLVVVGRTRPGTIGLRKNRILKIDDAVRCPIVSVSGEFPDLYVVSSVSEQSSLATFEGSLSSLSATNLVCLS